jgi:hypothetical protein
MDRRPANGADSLQRHYSVASKWDVMVVAAIVLFLLLWNFPL